MLSAAALVAVVAGGAGLATALTAGGRGSHLDAALVVKQVEVAIKDGAAAGYIGYEHETTTYNCGGAAWSEDDWFSSSEHRTEIFDGNGTLFGQLWYSGSGAGATGLEIDYGPRVEYQGPVPVEVQNGGYPQLNEEVAAGDFTLSGPTTLDGVSAYELSQTYPNGSATDIWVDASTFFLLKWVNTNAVITQAWDYTWQKPTAASLAEIAEPSLPAGFKQLQEPFLVSPGTHFVLPVSRGGAHTTVPAATTTVPAATTTAPGSATTAPAATTTVPRCSPGTTHRQ